MANKNILSSMYSEEDISMMILVFEDVLLYYKSVNPKNRQSVYWRDVYIFYLHSGICYAVEKYIQKYSQYTPIRYKIENLLDDYGRNIFLEEDFWFDTIYSFPQYNKKKSYEKCIKPRIKELENILNLLKK